MFYRCPENVSLRYSTKFITITLLSIVPAHHQEIKTICFILCLISFGEKSQGRPNCVLKWCLHSDVLTLHKKWSFLLRISLVNVTKSQETAHLVTFTEEILNGKLHFLCSVRASPWNIMQNTLILHYFSFYSPNFLREIFKS